MSTETILSAYTRGTHTHTHTDRGTRTHEHSDYTKLTLHSLKRTANSDFTAMDEDSSTDQKTWQIYSFGREKKVFRLHLLHLNESREGFCRRGRGRSFHVDGPKTERKRGNH